MEETPWANPEQPKYLVSGEANDEFDLRGLRDRIRSGALTPEHEISLVGSDVWKPASQYPALSRYFSLVAQNAAATASPLVRPSATAAGPAKSRYFAGIVYPFTSVSAVLFMLFGFVTALNRLLSIPVFGLASIFALAIIRTSADGQTRAPEANAVGGVVDWILDFLRTVAISLVSAWPWFVAVLLLMFTRAPWYPVIGVALLVMILYYPACLIAIARWKSVSMALSISTIFGLISTLGAPYFGAIAVFIALEVGQTIALVMAQATLGIRLALALRAATTIFIVFYVSHLLGWAVYRRRDRLA